MYMNASLTMQLPDFPLKESRFKNYFLWLANTVTYNLKCLC